MIKLSREEKIFILATRGFDYFEIAELLDIDYKEVKRIMETKIKKK